MTRRSRRTPCGRGDLAPVPSSPPPSAPVPSSPPPSAPAPAPPAAAPVAAPGSANLRHARDRAEAGLQPDLGLAMGRMLRFAGQAGSGR